MIGLLCSVQAEATSLLQKMRDTRISRIGSLEFTIGTSGERSVILCIGGMGKVNAAHAATLLITRFNADALVLFGIGGAYPSSGANIGDIMLASEEISGDEGVITSEGFKDTNFIGIPLAATPAFTCFNRFPSDPLLLGQIEKTLRDTMSVSMILTGPFVTISTCSGTNARAAELEHAYNALCENMEGAAGAHVAVLHEIPWIEVRAVSNIVEDRNMKKWDIPLAALRVQEAMVHVLEGWQ